MNIYATRKKVETLKLLVHWEYGYYKITGGLIEYYDNNAEFECVKFLLD